MSQRPLTLILPQIHRDTNGRRTVIQIGGVYTTFCQEEGILLQKYAIEMGGVSRYFFTCIGVRGRFVRKLEEAVAVQNSLLEMFSGKFRGCWEILPRFSGSTKCYPCQGLGNFRQGKWLLENWPRLRESSWIFSSETATAFLSFSESRRVFIFSSSA